MPAVFILRGFYEKKKNEASHTDEILHTHGNRAINMFDACTNWDEIIQDWSI